MLVFFLSFSLAVCLTFSPATEIPSSSWRSSWLMDEQKKKWNTAHRHDPYSNFVFAHRAILLVFLFGFFSSSLYFVSEPLSTYFIFVYLFYCEMAVMCSLCMRINAKTECAGLNWTLSIVQPAFIYFFFNVQSSLTLRTSARLPHRARRNIYFLFFRSTEKAKYVHNIQHSSSPLSAQIKQNTETICTFRIRTSVYS